MLIHVQSHIDRYKGSCWPCQEGTLHSSLGQFCTPKNPDYVFFFAFCLVADFNLSILMFHDVSNHCQTYWLQDLMVLSASPQSRIVQIIFDKAWSSRTNGGSGLYNNRRWSTKWPVTSGGHPHSDLNAQETWAKKICWICVACLANWVFFIVKGPVPVLYC